MTKILSVATTAIALAAVSTTEAFPMRQAIREWIAGGGFNGEQMNGANGKTTSGAASTSASPPPLVTSASRIARGWLPSETSSFGWSPRSDELADSPRVKEFYTACSSLPSSSQSPYQSSTTTPQLSTGANGAANGANGALPISGSAKKKPVPPGILDLANGAGKPAFVPPPPVQPDKDITNVFQQNKEWKQGRMKVDPDFFSKLGSVHEPTYMWIGCADARVPANVVMGEDAGKVFVTRNVANLVVNTDVNLMAGLQYAVDYLKIPHIIVCGHYECGGVKASMQNTNHQPPLENWLRNIRDVYRLHREELNAIRDPEARNRRLVELNVIEQCLNLFKTGVVQRRRLESYKEALKTGNPDAYTVPRIHACVFDPKTGDMVKLEVDFRKFIDDLHDIYDLYKIDDESIGKKPEPKTKNMFSLPML